MKALTVEKPGDGEAKADIREVPDPSPAAGEILVEVKASSINAADLNIARWGSGSGFIKKKTSPLMLGYDLSGVVLQAGGGFSEGDEVFGFIPYTGKTANGAIAERVAVDPSRLAKKPAELTHAHAAAAATVGCTALQGLRDKGRLEKGQRVLVNGASGGAGAYAVSIGKRLGATVVGRCSGSKADFVRGLGADEVVDRASTPMASISGGPFDVVFDVACASSYGESKSIMTPGGAYVVLLPSPAFIAGKIASLFSKRSVDFFAVAATPDDLTRVAGWLTEGMSPAVTETFPFAEAPAALQRFATGATLGKIAIEM